MNLQPGVKVGHYVLQEIIARGGMGVVWRAWDLERKELVALKAVANDLITDPEFRVRIQDEARRHQRLEHPNIVPVLDVFETGGDSCIVMQLIEGISLDKLLESKAQGRFAVEEAIPIVRSILTALDYAHQKGVVHRDIKPANILLDRQGSIKIIDFGIALAMGEKRRTRTGLTVGTPGYMSPEQIVKPRSIDHRSDVYSVGCVFYELLTGRPPFVRGQDGVKDNDFAVQHAQVTVTPIPPGSRVPGLPSWLDRLVMQALEKNPNDRIPGCREFLRLLTQRRSASDTSKLKKLVVSLVLTGMVLAIWLLVR